MPKLVLETPKLSLHHGDLDRLFDFDIQVKLFARTDLNLKTLAYALVESG